MTENTQTPSPAIQIMSQYIKDLSFEAPAMPHILMTMKSAPSITVDIDVRVNKTENPTIFTVDLNIKAEAKTAEDDKTVFICELIYGTLVALNVPAEHLEPMLVVEVPHLLFPYARMIMANVTREAGLPPLQINPIDFAALYREKVKKQEDKKDA